jgi:hypothetical protein
MIHTFVLYVSRYGTTRDEPAYKVVRDGDDARISVPSRE